jgi:hypothetical protein
MKANNPLEKTVHLYTFSQLMDYGDRQYQINMVVQRDEDKPNVIFILSAAEEEAIYQSMCERRRLGSRGHDVKTVIQEPASVAR